ncbi:RNA-binding protein [Pyrococcus furiosus DSM 3638]|uniref:THUMP domain-containing protein n=3 Tax=Pyrococcus furiosus TaxID=2261 RepID=Q8TZN0_PYRFU|nr:MULTISPECIES: THUMP domain-containing protein [Pyrococcus]AAL82082.1 hypothetical protein PF1958 [Pyrococcus furiosus DSM 3638]AFN04683.1 hypothetical protein PFC_08790 [Pyrococcus furiosus COM1]MDK2869378.1 tRNA acetyltransferase [Pyrococcus sp.]QEK79553.1 RNA-binding protein [Pyrococcus furiosus DSM 3638]
MKFLATCPPGREGDAMLELEWALNAKVKRTRWGGVLIGETPLGKQEAIERIKTFETFALQRFIPIDYVVPLEELENKIEEIAKTIPRGKFAVRAKVRGAKVGEKELERKLGSIIKKITENPVDLENPDVIVFVNVLKNKALISILRPGEIVKKKVED